MQPVNFSIVINTYNRAAWLATALESLRYLDYPAYEVGRRQRALRRRHLQRSQ